MVETQGIKIAVAMDTSGLEAGARRSSAALENMAKQVKDAGAEATDKIGSAFQGVQSASQAASGSIGGMVSSVRGLTASMKALGVAGMTAFAWAAGITAVVAAVGLLIERMEEAKRKAQELEEIRLDNLRGHIAVLQETYAGFRAEIERSASLLERMNAVQDRGRDQGRALKEAQLEREHQAALAGASTQEDRARIDAEFAYRAAKLRAESENQRRAEAIHANDLKKEGNLDLIANYRKEQQAMGGNWTGSPEAQKRWVELAGIIRRLEDENAVIDAENAVIEQGSAIAATALDTARIKRDAALAAIQAPDAAPDAGSAPEVRRGSALRVAADALARIGLGAGGGASSTDRKLDLQTRILEACRDAMRQVADNTRNPIASFA